MSFIRTARGAWRIGAGLFVCAGLCLVMAASSRSASDAAQQGFTALFNGQDFTGWKVPEGDGGHWKVLNEVIDYDAASQGRGDKSLWTVREYGDFVLQVDWRIKETPYINPNVP